MALQSITKALLSAASNGQPILVTATVDPGTLIHTATATNNINNMDEVVLYAFNNDTANHTLTLEVGGNGTANLIAIVIPGNAVGKVPIGRYNLNNGLTIKAYADSGSKIAIDGEVYSVAT